MTTGGPDTSDIFEEEVNPSDPKQYRYDGQWRDFTIRKETINVKNGDKVEPREVTLAFSHHGPIVARKNGKAYAMAIPYANEVGLSDQCFRDDDGTQPRRDETGPVASATDGAEHHGRHGAGRHLLPAERARADPCQGGRSQPADPGQYVGDRVARASTRSSDLVQIENPPCGWMQNCNCSPAAMMNQDQPRREQYAEHASPLQ